MATKTTKTKSSSKHTKDDDVLKKPKSAKTAVLIKKQPLLPEDDENEFVEFNNINSDINDPEEEWDKEFESFQASTKKKIKKDDDDDDFGLDENLDDYDYESDSDNFNDYDDYDSRRKY